MNKYGKKTTSSLEYGKGINGEQYETVVNDSFPVLAISQYVSFTDYIEALREVGFQENRWKDHEPLHANGDESIMGIKCWHDAEHHCGVACIIERGFKDDKTNTRHTKIEMYQYVGEPDSHRRLEESQAETMDYSKYWDELVELGVIEFKD